jgi:hypothetical protein
MCRYWWRVFRDGSRVLYAKVDGGLVVEQASGM